METNTWITPDYIKKLSKLLEKYLKPNNAIILKILFTGRNQSTIKCIRKINLKVIKITRPKNLC